MVKFKLASDYVPRGDQPQAIEKITKNMIAGVPHQVLLGVTGSGKTFTMANVIERVQRPTLVISHNKTLAAQLYAEFKTLFPRMRSTSLSAITITISPRPICRKQTPI